MSTVSWGGESPYESGWRPTTLADMFGPRTDYNEAEYQQLIDRYESDLSPREMAIILANHERDRVRLEAVMREFAAADMEMNDEAPTLRETLEVVADYVNARPWVQVLALVIGALILACIIQGAPDVWAGLTDARNW